jgi:VWFA-related protein
LKKILFTLSILLLFVMPVSLWAMQNTPAQRMEITGVNASNLPEVIVTANVYDSLGRPVLGLTQAEFSVHGELAGQARIVSVENITDDNLPFATVLVIDTSSSMDGQPIEQAKEAARVFVNSIGPNDPVAILTFDTAVRTVIDYTTDKTALLNAIDSLAYGGKTALYRGALEGITTAENSPTPRRAVILLSDGAEFGNVSNAERGAALEEAIQGGVTAYTIGLGFGTDRTYLRELASGTNAEFYESPTPDQLVEIYRNLANLLRSQYVITLETDLPADGTEYDLTLQATTPQGDVSASATLRTPIPTPIITLPELPAEISELTTIEVGVAADDGVTDVTFSLDGGEAVSEAEAPYTFEVDPVALTPGAHSLSITATDGSGDVTSETLNFNVAALPSTITVSPDVNGTEISSVQTITVEASGQTPAQSASFSLDGNDPTLDTEASFEFTIDPVQLTPGEHTLTINVVNEGGGLATAEQTFIVPQLPASFVIRGLENGQSLDAPVEVLVDILGSQTPVTELNFSINGEAVDNGDRAEGSLLIDPNTLQPGASTLTVTIVEESGQETSQNVDFLVAALPAQVTVNGLTSGETLTENRVVSVDATGQTPITDVSYSLDGEFADAPAEAPYEFEIDVLAIEPGAHILSVTVTNEGGQQQVVDVPFIISDAPSLTATASVPTNTPRPTNTSAPTATGTPQPPTNTPTVDFDATANADATATGEVMALAVATQDQATADAQSTQDALATLNAEATANQALTLESMDADERATLDAQATLDARATTTADARATANALSTLNAQATENAQATLDAEATSNAQATQDRAETRRTQAAANLQATAETRATLNALATSFAQATVNAEATRDAQADQTATIDAQSTATEGAALTATADAQGTLDAEETEEATEAPTETEAATTVAQAVEDNATPTPDDEGTAVPTVTPIGSLTEEVAETSPASSNIVPILIVCGAGFIILLVIFLILRGRRADRTNPPNNTTRR